MNNSLKRVVLWVGATVLVAVIATTVLQALSSHLSLLDNPPPGRLVELNGRQVHVLCYGEGSPTVILEAGLPGGSLAWMSVLPKIAEVTRVCAYDRPGYGWSQATTSPRTAETIVQELRMLLQNADIEAPYVLVGHSFGGLLMQLYATRFPEGCGGVVLVDSSHPDQAHRTLDLKKIEGIAQAMRILGPLGLARMLLPVPAGNPDSREASVRELERDLLMSNRTLRAVVTEMSSLRQSLQEVADSSVSFGDKPLMVLTEGRRQDETWQAMQEDLSRLSSNSAWQVVADAGHFIQHDRPDAVVEAVRRVLGELRSTTHKEAP